MSSQHAHLGTFGKQTFSLSRVVSYPDMTHEKRDEYNSLNSLNMTNFPRRTFHPNSFPDKRKQRTRNSGIIYLKEFKYVIFMSLDYGKAKTKEQTLKQVVNKPFSESTNK